MDLGLTGVRAVVTAASKGLGRACAGALTAEGARVFICSRDRDRIAETAQALGAAGGMACDLTSSGDITDFVRAAVECLGGIDVLVTNSGPPPAMAFEEADDDSWMTAYNTTLMSAVRVIRAAMPHLRRSGRGRIVNITGYGWREPVGGLVLSEAARAGVTVLAKTLADDLGPDGVTVNNIAPGPIMTDRLVELQEKAARAAGITRDEQLRRFTASIPVRRMGVPEDVGSLCAFLSSDAAGFVTGQTIVVDGGINRSI